MNNEKCCRTCFCYEVLWCGLNSKPVNPIDYCEEYVDKDFIVKEVIRLSKENK